MSDAYLDIETTGLSSSADSITVIGIYRDDTDETHQLVGKDITKPNLMSALEGVQTIYTYNGSRFDLPFISSSLYVNLADYYRHHDLMYDCWEANLFGGFKSVEHQLGISRELEGVNGIEAVILWFRYTNHGDREALERLLHYNREDVVNLKALREKLPACPLDRHDVPGKVVYARRRKTEENSV